MKTRNCSAKDCIRPAKWAMFAPDPKAPLGAVLVAVWCGQHKPQIRHRGLARLIPFDVIAVKEKQK